jgi:hypothetical protein
MHVSHIRESRKNVPKIVANKVKGAFGSGRDIGTSVGHLHPVLAAHPGEPPLPLSDRPEKGG